MKKTHIFFNVRCSAELERAWYTCGYAWLTDNNLSVMMRSRALGSNNRVTFKCLRFVHFLAYKNHYEY